LGAEAKVSCPQTQLLGDFGNVQKTNRDLMLNTFPLSLFYVGFSGTVCLSRSEQIEKMSCELVQIMRLQRNSDAIFLLSETNVLTERQKIREYGC